METEAEEVESKVLRVEAEVFRKMPLPNPWAKLVIIIKVHFIFICRFLPFFMLDFVFKYYIEKSENFCALTTTPFFKNYYRPTDQNFDDNEQSCNVCTKFEPGGMFNFCCIFIFNENPK